MLKLILIVLVSATTLVLWAGRALAAAEAVKVTTDGTVDASSLETIVADVTRLSGAKTNDEKAIAIYNWLHSAIFHRAYPVEAAPQSVGPLKLLNVYGWGLCGGQHAVLKALFETASWQVRYRGWTNPAHSTVEVYYDGAWHYFDVFLKCYYWTKDKSTVAGQDDIVTDPSIALDGLKDVRVPIESYLCCGDEVEAVVSGCKSSKAHPPAQPSDGWASVTGRDQGYRALLTLRSGAALRLEWKNEPGMMVSSDPNGGNHTCGTKDFRSNPVLGPVLEHYGPRAYANGAFAYAPEFSKPADVADIELTSARAENGKLVADGQGVAVFRADLPYPYASAAVDMSSEAGEARLFVSVDSGRTWQPVKAGDVSTAVRQRYDVFFKVEFTGALTSFAVDAVVEHNRCVLPYLLPGKNVVTVTAADNQLPPDTTLDVTYAYQEAAAPDNRQRWDGTGITYNEPQIVTRSIDSLPATFEITAGGNTPPKMLYLERSLRAR